MRIYKDSNKLEPYNTSIDNELSSLSMLGYCYILDNVEPKLCINIDYDFNGRDVYLNTLKINILSFIRNKNLNTILNESI